MEESNNDDDFGGFEEANTSPSVSAAAFQNNDFLSLSSAKESQPSSASLPDWLVVKPQLSPSVTSTTLISNNPNDQRVIKSLQEELARVKQELATQQAKHNRELNDKLALMSQAFAQALKDTKETFDKRLVESEQRFLASQEMQQNKAIEMLESKLCEYQEKLIKYTESKCDDMEMKTKSIVGQVVRDENGVEKLKARQSMDVLESKLKQDIEKHSQSYFFSQSELLKEQIKSSILQEHLIHKDLIQNKLDRLQKNSDEKRKKTTQLYARHLSGLNFFIDNAHKQLSVLKEAHTNMLKNKELADDFYNTTESNTTNAAASVENSDLYVNKQLNSLRLSARTSTEFDEDLIDENLLKDF